MQRKRNKMMRNASHKMNTEQKTNKDNNEKKQKKPQIDAHT